MGNDPIHIPAEPLVECPACGLPAEITDRFTLDGAPGPVEHVKVACAARHWFTLPADMLAPAATPSPARASTPVSGRFRMPVRVLPSSQRPLRDRQ